jgi:kanamycin kinase
VPEIVTRLAAGRCVAAVWLNELGGVTFSIGGVRQRRGARDEPSGGEGQFGDGAEYVKTGPGDYAPEAARLLWAGRYVTVPTVLARGPDWLHTAGLPGSSAVDRRWTDDPAVAARAIGAGLRHLHDTLPVDSCPFDWSVPTRLTWLTPEARPGLAEAPPTDRLVVCHGDACAPNTLIDDDGRWCGHVDLGALGVADRWADLAVATLSLDWNYAGSWEDELLEAYGIEPDGIRIEYYRRLWEAPEMGDG